MLKVESKIASPLWILGQCPHFLFYKGNEISSVIQVLVRQLYSKVQIF